MKEIKNRQKAKKEIKLNKPVSQAKVDQFKIKTAKYDKIDKTLSLTKRSVLMTKKGKINQKQLAELTKVLNDSGVFLTKQDVQDMIVKIYHERQRAKSVKAYSILNYYSKITAGNLVKFFLENMNIDIHNLAAKLEVSVDWLLNENNWDWKLNKRGERITPTRLHTTPNGKNVNFDWCYNGGTVVNVQ